jgi:hypothetical protein
MVQFPPGLCTDSVDQAIASLKGRGILRGGRGRGRARRAAQTGPQPRPARAGAAEHVDRMMG